jgi:hypothetical protein
MAHAGQDRNARVQNMKKKQNNNIKMDLKEIR